MEKTAEFLVRMRKGCLSKEIFNMGLGACVRI